MNYDELSSLGKMAYARYRDTPPTITAGVGAGINSVDNCRKKLHFRCLKCALKRLF